MATTVEEDFGTALATRLSRSVGTDLFYGKIRAPGDGVPYDCVFVRATGGPEPLVYGGQTATDTRFSQVQVVVRGDPDDYAGALSVARTVRDQMHKNPPSASYFGCRALESEPLILGEEDSAGHLFSLNFQLWHDQ